MHSFTDDLICLLYSQVTELEPVVEESELKRQRISIEKNALKRRIEQLENELLNVQHNYLALENEESDLLSSLEMLDNNKTNPTLLDASLIGNHINIIIDCKAVCVPRTDIIYLTDIETAAGNSSTSFADKYQHGSYRKKEFVYPRGITYIATKDWGKYRVAYDQMQRLHDLLEKKQCSFSRTAQYYLGLACHTKY